MYFYTLPMAVRNEVKTTKEFVGELLATIDF